MILYCSVILKLLGSFAWNDHNNVHTFETVSTVTSSENCIIEGCKCVTLRTEMNDGE